MRASTSRVRGRTIAECPTVSGEAAVRAAARVGQAVTLRSGRPTNAGCGARGRRRTRVAERNGQRSDGATDRSVRDAVLVG